MDNIIKKLMLIDSIEEVTIGSIYILVYLKSNVLRYSTFLRIKNIFDEYNCNIASLAFLGQKDKITITVLR